ncbi:uncharacterized protein EI90DRAFT_3126245 [Cantharellus anzutake]|uniref:uncharacterized protein n=1 Tax=Cantharellus anzutake TaxID=1750568 RepID=UPI0019038508|nr:uncharacterized protein EI90DRAFT_3126245 [Cantharellus anzutake]KAF8328444.1 hypothetical protein EI90DRAFT_3126245 [Cantharellus anzutake]
MSNKDYYQQGGSGPYNTPPGPPPGQYYPPQGPPPQGGYYPQQPPQAYQPGPYQPQPQPQTVYVQGPPQKSTNDGTCMACLAGICKCRVARRVNILMV